MNNKKPKRRFYSAYEILKEIEKYKQKETKLIADAVVLDAEADQLYRAGPAHAENAGFKRERAKKLRRSAYLIETKKLPFLSQKLAEFRTETLPNIGITDKSVQATKG